MIHKILIADDEPLQCSGLRDIILKQRPGLQIETARNGKAAADRLPLFRPDLVIADIRMPIMDGLQLAEFLQKNYPETRTVLISAYQEFTYAQQAIKFGVRDYLVKPYKSSEIIRLLQGFDEADEKTARETDSLSDREMLLSRLLEGKLSEEERRVLQADPALTGPGCVANGILSAVPANGADSRSRCGTVLQSLPEWFRGHVKNSFAVSAAYEQSGLWVFLPGLTDTQAEDIIRGLCEHICADCRLTLFFGISGCCKNILSGGKDAADQAREARSYRFYRPSGCRRWSDISADTPAVFPSLNIWKQELNQSVNLCDIRALHRTMEKVGASFSQPPFYPPAMVKHRVSGMAVSVFDSFELQLKPADFEMLHSETYEKTAEADTLDALLGVCETMLNTAAALIGSRDKPTRNQFFSDCLAWVEKNIDRDISLMEAAEHFHFNANYLSGMIKQKTGMSYGQYVLSLRMNKARSLLETSDERIQDIAVKVGYRDASYFNRIFKREINLTPEQYRRSHVK